MGNGKSRSPNNLMNKNSKANRRSVKILSTIKRALKPLIKAREQAYDALDGYGHYRRNLCS
jgi:hypothetical protein